MIQPKRPTLVDLFSGAGGFSLGFAAAGCKVVAGVDFDEASGSTYAENFGRLAPDDPPRVLAGKEGGVEGLDFGSVADAAPDILIGGPPCQGFSRIGRAKLNSLHDGDAEDAYADDVRNVLYWRFLEAARFWQPKAVVMENVPGMLSVRGENLADVVAGEVGALGYRVGYAVLNSVWFGVPQFRERFFLMGIRRDLGIEPQMPSATHRVELPLGYLKPKDAYTVPLPFIHHFELPVDLASANRDATTVSEALDDLPRLDEHLAGARRLPPDRLHEAMAYPRAPHSKFARLMRDWPGFGMTEGVTEHVIRRTPRDYETFRRMRPDDRYPQALKIALERFEEKLTKMREELGELDVYSRALTDIRKSIVPPYPVDKFVDKWRKLNPGRPSWTIPAHLSKDAYSHIHFDDTQARAISIREAARIQSFPDAFRFSGNMGDCYRQIGNAVPPVMAWAIARKLLELLGLQPVGPNL